MPGSARSSTMRAVVRDAYGPARVLAVRLVPRPGLTEDGVLVRVHAASLNRADWYAMTGTPLAGRFSQGLRRPRATALGTDFAGTVEAVGSQVSGIRPGDEVFGGRSGALAEYLCVRVAVALKPANLTHEQAAAVPLGAVTALQGLRDKGRVRPGQRVLVNGSSGGVGTFAVQIAKALGAEVTAVCGPSHAATARAIGADHVVDYTREDFTRASTRYDVLFDNAGSRSWRECTRVLAPDATVVLVGGPLGKPVFGPLGHIAGMRLASLVGPRRSVFFIASYTRPDLETLRDFVESGSVTPVVDRTYDLADVADAMHYLGEGHADGKVVVRI